MGQHLLTPVCMLSGVFGEFQQGRNTGRRRAVYLPGMQQPGSVCHKEADTVPVSSCVGFAPEEVQLCKNTRQSFLCFV